MAKRNTNPQTLTQYQRQKLRAAEQGKTVYQLRIERGIAKGQHRSQAYGHARRGLLPVNQLKQVPKKDLHFLRRIEQITNDRLRAKTLELWKKAYQEGWLRAGQNEKPTSLDKLIFILNNFDNRRIWRGTYELNQKDFNAFMNEIMGMVGTSGGEVDDETIDGIMEVEGSNTSLYNYLKTEGFVEPPPPRKNRVKTKTRKKK